MVSTSALLACGLAVANVCASRMLNLVPQTVWLGADSPGRVGRGISAGVRRMNFGSKTGRLVLVVSIGLAVFALARGQRLPRLSVGAVSGGRIEIAWPYTNSGFVLLSASALSGTNWQTSNVLPNFHSNTLTFSAAILNTDRAQFFRLTQPADLRGLYVYVPMDLGPNAPGNAVVTNAINLPGIDGMLLVGLWSSLETNFNQYDWSPLDKWMNYAATRGKKVTLSLRAGDGIPDWLFLPPPNGPGATNLTFTISPKDGKTSLCQTDSIAIPWDPVFLNAWNAMLTNVAYHLRMTGTYSNLTLLRLTGINRTSDELRLPAQTPDNNPLTGTGMDCVSNAPAIWQTNGYLPSRLLSAWSSIVESFATSFPDKSFSVAIIPYPPQVPFPPIDDYGNLITNNLPDQNAPLLQWAEQILPGRLVVQFNFLMTSNPAQPAVIAAATNYGSLPAFQANNWLAASNGGSACGGTVTNPAVCDDAAYLNLLQQGIYPLGTTNWLRSQYIEVWATNAAVFTNAIWQAHLELLAD